MKLSILLCFIWGCSAITIYRGQLTRLGPGETGYLDEWIDYARCHVLSSGNPYSVGSSTYREDVEFGLRGGYTITNRVNWWSGGGGIYAICY